MTNLSIFKGEKSSIRILWVKNGILGLLYDLKFTIFFNEKNVPTYPQEKGFAPPLAKSILIAAPGSWIQKVIHGIVIKNFHSLIQNRKSNHTVLKMAIFTKRTI